MLRIKLKIQNSRETTAGPAEATAPDLPNRAIIGCLYAGNAESGLTEVGFLRRQDYYSLY